MIGTDEVYTRILKCLSQCSDSSWRIKYLAEKNEIFSQKENCSLLSIFSFLVHGVSACRIQMIREVCRTLQIVDIIGSCIRQGISNDGAFLSVRIPCCIWKAYV